MNNIRLEKTEKYMCTSKITEEFATEKSVMLIATTTEQ